MESELLIAMLLVGVGAASLGVLLASRTWPAIHGHEALTPVSASGEFQGRSIWICDNRERARSVVHQRIGTMAKHSRVLYLPNPMWGGAIEVEGVRRMRAARPSVQEVVDAASALSVYGSVVLLVEGAEALEPTAADESTMAAVEELFEICSTPIGVVLTEEASLPTGDWSVERLSG